MIGDAMIITVSVCLFIYLGLFNAIAGILKRLVPVNPEKIGRLSGKLKCSKCISFWLTLAYSIACGGPVIRCILVFNGRKIAPVNFHPGSISRIERITSLWFLPASSAISSELIVFLFGFNSFAIFVTFYGIAERRRSAINPPLHIPKRQLGGY